MADLPAPLWNIDFFHNRWGGEAGCGKVTWVQRTNVLLSQRGGLERLYGLGGSLMSWPLGFPGPCFRVSVRLIFLWEVAEKWDAGGSSVVGHTGDTRRSRKL